MIETESTGLSDMDSRFDGPAVLLPAQAIRPARARFDVADDSDDLELVVRVMSYNLLAPPYRAGHHGLPRDHASPPETDAEWRARTARHIDEAVAARPDVLGLQEYWANEPRFCAMWEAFADEHGYAMFTTQRTSDRKDGCCLLVRSGCGLSDLKAEAFGFDDWANRVAQVLTATLPGGAPLTLVNVHLGFPHENAHDPAIRFHQGRKLGELLAGRAGAAFCFGDMNGDLADPALMMLQKKSGLHCMDWAPHDWNSHCSHLGTLMACDLLFTTPGMCRVDGWRHGGTEEALLAGTLPSDHRPLHAEVAVVLKTTAGTDAITNNTYRQRQRDRMVDKNSELHDVRRFDPGNNSSGVPTGGASDIIGSIKSRSTLQS